LPDGVNDLNGAQRLNGLNDWNGYLPPIPLRPATMKR
jgi:hypothetical protein